MPKFKIFYILSLLILGVLLLFTVFKPMTTSGEYSEVQEEQLLQTEDQWIIQFDIVNHEGDEQNYTINVSVDGKPYKQEVLISGGRKFTYIHHVYADSINHGDVIFTIYEKGKNMPLEEIIYHLK